ncbi:MAG: cation diffusion facilitator family transporter [Actinomycetota bacterium]
MSHTSTCELEGPHSHATPDIDARTRSGLRAVGLSLGILVATAIAQGLVLLASGSVALLADLIHNVGDALTALPVGIAFLLRSARAEKYAGWTVVLAIAVSMIVADVAALDKLINSETPDHLLVLALAGIIGVAGNGVAAGVRTRAGRTLHSSALIADGHHAKVDALVSGGVVLTSVLIGVGVPLADPIVALLITAMIGHVLVEAWHTVSGREQGHAH